MENKYYIPEISELFVGYECEKQINFGYESFNDGKEIWLPIKIGYKDEKEGAYTNELSNIINEFDDGCTPIKTPFLRKEQIVDEGWENILEMDEDGAFEADKSSQGVLFLIRWSDDKMLSVYEDSYKNRIFYGNCRCINDFRQITKKFLNI